MAILGIDLGTTYSAIGVFENGTSRLINNCLGEHLTPSAVAFDKDGQLLVGAAAKAMLATDPNRVVTNFKRFMGTDKTYKLAGHRLTPIELSAMVLKSLRDDASADLKEEIHEVVISVPAYFNDPQRKATIQAAKYAQLKVRRLINEPTAAALAYSLHEEEEDSHIFVFDLGGGTFDVSIIEKFDDIMEIHASAGNAFLGGEDFTDIVFTHFREQLTQQGLKLGKKDLHRLRLLAERHKLRISQKESIRFAFQDAYYELEMSPELFKQHAEALIKNLRGPCERAVRDAKLNANELDHVVLVGGASRMKFIRQMVGGMFGQLPKSHLDPDRVVAQGATIQAALIDKDKSLDEKILTDVVPHTLGINISEQVGHDKYIDGLFLPIIERNNTVPISREKSVSPINPRSKKLMLKVYQGESRQVKDNVFIGQLEVSITKRPADEEEVNVRFTYDTSGLLEVQAEIASTGQIFTKILRNDDIDISDEAARKIFKKLESIKIHPRDQIENKTLIIKAEALYQELLGDERQTVGDVINYFQSALETQDPTMIKEAKHKCDDFLAQYREFF